MWCFSSWCSFCVYPPKFLFSRLLGGMVGLENIDVMAQQNAATLIPIYGLGFAVFGLFALLYLHAYALRQKFSSTLLRH